MKKMEFVVRVHSTEQKLQKLRKFALKTGAISVTTTTIVPNLIEAILIFKKKSEASTFENWLDKERDCVLL